MAATTGPIPYSLAANAGEGFFSSFVLGETALVTLVSTAGAVTLVIQRYGEAPVSIPVPAATTYATTVNNIQTVGVLAGAAAATGNVTINILETA